MTMKFHFNHFNINVHDLERSKDFYKKALGLTKVGEIDHPDKGYIITYLSSEGETFRLELTYLSDHQQPYELGENESHLAFSVDTQQDFNEAYKLRKEMDIICYENPEMGIYFIEDPDGYWIEIIPPRLKG